MRRVLFPALALLLPFLVLALAEGGLRLLGVHAGDRAVFIPVPGHPDYRVFNPAYAARYFQGFRPAVAYDPFREEREEGTFRVFVLGGSSAAGFPYHAAYAFPERLAQRFVATGRTVEVVNLGMTAVNSYTLWDLAEAVADQAPDAVLIYAGHNEYYGAFGAGSTVYGLANQRWLKRLVLRLKHLVLYRLLESLLAPEAASAPTDRTMMARVVRTAGIAPGSPTYRAGIDQFAENMASVLATFRARGIPVYLGTLTSNLADQPPLGDDPEASAAYARGRERLAAGDTVEARRAFVRARQHDPVRFRAPDTLNAIIRGLAAQPGVTLVPVAAAFHAHGLEGNALFDDHLHPNARGYDLMAEAFFRALAPGDPHDVVPPVPDPYERAVVALQLARLKGGYPFDKTATPEEANRRFQALLNRRRRMGPSDSLAVLSLTHGLLPPQALLTAVRSAVARRDTLAALRLYYGLLPWQPFNLRIKDEAVGLAVKVDPALPVVGDVLRLAVRHTRTPDHLDALAAVELRRGRLGPAGVWLAAVERVLPEDPVMLFNTARLRVLEGDTAAARAYFERYRRAQAKRP